ncbi:hypothetical protein AVEN_114123-1 [Araneus ventricosus]|uniref:Uncharacterized protein n=1 Tax=Araneus ventricosus TaxID=182803 RepID=A0A4Y2Q2H1_ARAVE|nr:hypothetical protein AVEN_114123-1 [Araneus ventricosus]
MANDWCYRSELRLSTQSQFLRLFTQSQFLRLSAQSYSEYRNFHCSLSAVEILLSPDNPQNSHVIYDLNVVRPTSFRLQTPLFRIQDSTDHNSHSASQETGKQ